MGHTVQADEDGTVYHHHRTGDTMQTIKVVPCECSDPGCPCMGKCTLYGNTTLYRVDMIDKTGTPMCDRCADDALDSGVFTIDNN